MFTLGNPPPTVPASKGLRKLEIWLWDKRFLPHFTGNRIRNFALICKFKFTPGQLLSFPSSGYSAAYMKEACLVRTGQELALEKPSALQALTGPLAGSLEEAKLLMGMEAKLPSHL